MKVLNIHQGTLPHKATTSDGFNRACRGIAIGIAAILSLVLLYKVAFDVFYNLTPELHGPMMVADFWPLRFNPAMTTVEALCGGFIGLAATAKKHRLLLMLLIGFTCEVLLVSAMGVTRMSRLYPALGMAENDFFQLLSYATVAMVYTLTRQPKRHA